MSSSSSSSTIPSKSSRCVFVGNIPYDATEQQMIEIFQQAGPVVSFRLVFDRETGKPKGYGFCEYRDAETALSAMRNLNNHEFSGRTLRVDFAENEKANIQALPVGSTGTTKTGASSTPTMGATPDSISGLLEGMTTTQIYEVVSNMKDLAQQNPDQAKQLLISNPQLSIALLHAQILLGMTNVQTVQKMIQAKAAQSFQQIPSPSPSLLGLPPGQPGFKPQTPTAPFPQTTSSSTTPPFGHQFTQFPPQPQNAQYPSVFADLDQQKILQQVVSLTPEQIEKLPPDQKAQVQQLRQTILQNFPQYNPSFLQ